MSETRNQAAEPTRPAIVEAVRTREPRLFIDHEGVERFGVLLAVHECDHLLAALPQWRSMESAPKDGTDILLFVESRCVVGHWGDDCSSRGVCSWTDSEYTFSPLVWCPPPPAPTPEKKS